METAAALAELRGALKEAVARSRLSGREISRRLGRHWGYLTRVLNGRLRLKVRETAQLLELLEVEAEDFFDAVFPLGGVRAAPLVELEPPEADPQRQREPLSPRELTTCCGRLLRAVLRRRGLTQRAVSRRLGLSSDALGLALRGSTQLSFWHLFAVLEEVGMEPGRFFAELFGPDDRAITDSYRWVQYLDQIEAALAGTAGAGPEAAPSPRRGKGKPRQRRRQASPPDKGDRHEGKGDGGKKGRQDPHT